jgi:threonylcarbamoyladenosine tRNA methylthiotransferase MtaB
MVGFAGETEEDFNESLSFAKEIGFAKAHIFCYSRREGTIAFNMPNQVTKAEKHRRSIELNEACKKTEEKFLSSLIGQQQEVLFETEENGFFEGFTKNYSRVRVMSTKDLSGKCLNCLIKELDGEILIGELI